MSKAKLLIAEDNESNFLLIEWMLKDEYQIVRALNGDEAVKLFEIEHPYAILMDVRMPITDGITATIQIREKDPHIPIIALTAQAYESDRQMTFEAGCNGFISKPINVLEFRDELRKILEKVKKQAQ